ncbi:MAG: hypothetical protein H0U75_03110 [Legionella sp.]|nr:hypothetical protein [Legionella sp.]
MRNLKNSLLILIFISLLQLLTYHFFLRPMISTWGASPKEISMVMAGDDNSQIITSTRAISINAKRSDVWMWLIQLGADRGGFYSYYFIEKMLGYKTRHQNIIKPEFMTMKAGDLIRGSIDESRSIIPYNFLVLYVKPEESFVLDKWGTFLLRKVNDKQTRLIIRTQEPESSSSWSKAANYIAIPLHYIMERRTLMGIKARVEAGEGVELSLNKDMLWFLNIVMSGFLICYLIYIGRGMFQSVILPFIFSSYFLFSILIFNPVPLYSLVLLVGICLAIFWVHSKQASRKTHKRCTSKLLSCT